MDSANLSESSDDSEPVEHKLTRLNITLTEALLAAQQPSVVPTSPTAVVAAPTPILSHPSPREKHLNFRFASPLYLPSSSSSEPDSPGVIFNSPRYSKLSQLQLTMERLQMQFEDVVSAETTRLYAVV